MERWLRSLHRFFRDVLPVFCAVSTRTRDVVVRRCVEDREDVGEVSAVNGEVCKMRRGLPMAVPLAARLVVFFPAMEWRYEMIHGYQRTGGKANRFFSLLVCGWDG